MRVKNAEHWVYANDLLTIVEFFDCEVKRTYRGSPDLLTQRVPAMIKLGGETIYENVESAE